MHDETDNLPPIPPPNRIIREGIGRFCPKCGSTMTKKGMCDQPLCEFGKKQESNNVERIDIALQVLNVILTLALLIGNMYFMWKVI